MRDVGYIKYAPGESSAVEILGKFNKGSDFIYVRVTEKIQTFVFFPAHVCLQDNTSMARKRREY
jgi:hypothetical protein